MTDGKNHPSSQFFNFFQVDKFRSSLGKVMQIQETELKHTMFSIDNLNVTNAITIKSLLVYSLLVNHYFSTRKMIDNLLQQSILSDTVNGELELGLKRDVYHALGTVAVGLICIQYIYIFIKVIRRHFTT